MVFASKKTKIKFDNQIRENSRFVVLGIGCQNGAQVTYIFEKICKNIPSIPNIKPVRDIKKTKPRIHQFTNLKYCKMSLKAFKMKKQGLKGFFKVMNEEY